MARRRRRKSRSALPAVVAVLVAVAGVRLIWINVNHWLILAAVLAAVGVAAGAWVLALRRRERTWLYEYDHATLPGRRYIGITKNPDARYAQERDRSWWFASTTGQMRLVKCYRSWKLADAAETAAIVAAAEAREPLANDRKVPQHIRQARIAQHSDRGWTHV